MSKNVIFSSLVALGTLILFSCVPLEEYRVKEEKVVKEAKVVEEEKPVKEKKVLVEKPGDILMIDDFDDGAKPNNVGGDLGAWDRDPADETQTCREYFTSEVKCGEKGYSMKIDYDVDSPSPAFNGYWTKLQHIDVTPYKNFVFYVKGDEQDGFTTQFKIELKNTKKEVGKYYVKGVTLDWQKVVVPLKNFVGITDFSKMTEFVVVFEDRIATDRDGAIYIDSLYFSK
jgi:hypothetical protein